METNSEKRSSNKLFIILSVLFFVISCALGYQLYTQKNKTETVIVEKDKVTGEYETVKSELSEVKQAYEGLHTNNKQLQSELDAKREELEDLTEQLEKYKGNEYMITKLKKELQTIRNLIKSYLHDIDSLHTLNQNLKAENTRVNESLNEEKSKSQQLNTEKDKLSKTVELGSKLKAMQLFADGIKVKGSSKEVSSTKAKRVEKVRACFTLSENSIAKAEDKMIYMKITGPDGRVLANNSDDDSGLVINGEKLQYSAKKEVHYENEAKDMCMYFDKREEFIAGKYKVEIYTDGVSIGSTSFELK